MLNLQTRQCWNAAVNFRALRVKTVSLRSLQRNIGFFERSCESSMIRIRLENGRSAGNSGRGNNPLSQIRRSNARHDTTRENPLYLSEQSRDIPFRRVNPSRAPSAPEYWPDSDQRERERERARACVCVCVCKCVCQTLLLRVIAPSAGHRWTKRCCGDTWWWYTSIHKKKKLYIY